MKFSPAAHLPNGVCVPAPARAAAFPALAISSLAGDCPLSLWFPEAGHVSHAPSFSPDFFSYRLK